MPEPNTLVFGISFVCYTLFIVAIGLLSARKARRSDADYFLAGRSLGKWVAALSASASSESAWVTLGLAGWAYGSGVQAYWIIPGCLLGYLFNWWVIAPRLRDRAGHLDALTVPDLFAFHFRERFPFVRLLSVIVIFVAMTLYVAAQFNAAGKAFAFCFEGVSYQGGVLIGATIVLIYTVTGGFRAVCWTDFLQALLMVIALVIFPIYLLLSHGGWSFVTEQLGADDPAMLQWLPDYAAAGAWSIPMLMGFLIGSGALGINLGYPGQPHVLVRFMALRDRNDAYLSGVIAASWGLLVYWGAVTVGLFARAMTLTNEAWTTALTDGDLGLVASAYYLLNPIIGGLVLAAVLAAICSTADSQLVVAASAAAHDFFRRIVRKGANDEAGSAAQTLINRAMVLVLGLIAMLLVIDPDQKIKVFEYVLTYGWAVLGAAFGPQIILLVLWRRASYVGCVLGMLSGFAGAIIWKHTYIAYRDAILAADPGAAIPEIYNLTFAFALAFVVNVLASFIWPDRRENG